VEDRERMLDEVQLRAMSTGDLVSHALNEARLLVRAEVLHAKQELKEEIKAARTSGILLGMAGGLSLCACAVLFSALAVALPWAEWLSFLVTGGVLLAAAGLCGVLGTKALPKKPLQRTQERLKQDYTLTRERLA